MEFSYPVCLGENDGRREEGEEAERGKGQGKEEGRREEWEGGRNGKEGRREGRERNRKYFPEQNSVALTIGSVKNRTER